MKSAIPALVLMPAIALSQVGDDFGHEHGTGHLEITFSGAEFALSLVVPGADIVGFEGPAETDEDRALVAGAVSDLSRPLRLFSPSEDAGCVTVSANVTLTGEGLGQGEGTVSASDQPVHSEFRADYVVQCQDIDALDSLQFLYFERFPAAERLIVEVFPADQSQSQDVTRNVPELAF